jgi:hypothetical protein
MKIPPPMHQTVGAIYAWHEKRNAAEPPRLYLGASVIGRECLRAAWYSYRQALPVTFSGQTLRIFDTGHRFEPRISDELRGIGVDVREVDEDTGEQFRWRTLGGHFSGAVDGLAKGFPEAPKTLAVTEYKTLNDKTWKDVAKKGVEQAKPQYWQQAHVNGYMMEIDRVAFIAHNKNDDSLLFEWIHVDKAVAEAVIAKAKSVIEANDPPAKISDDPAFYLCGWCEFKTLCHGEAVPLVGCRTCLHSTPIMDRTDAAWRCEFKKKRLPAKGVVKCSAHRYIPALLANLAEPIDADAERNIVFYRRKDGSEFANDKAGI